MMKFTGGYDILLEGEPRDDIATLVQPGALYLPLFSRSLHFSELQVEDGQSVTEGQILAVDPQHFSTPLLSPVSGTIRLNDLEYHIIIEFKDGSSEAKADQEAPDDKRQALVRFGVWPFLRRVSDKEMPDPESMPEALVIPVARFEPYHPSPEIFLHDQVERFIDGLMMLRDIFEKAEIYLVFPDTDSSACHNLKQTVKNNAGWIKLIEVPHKYPNDNPALIAQGLNFDIEKVWTFDAQAVLGAEQALNYGRPFVKRIISVGGPEAEKPCHYHVPIGFPLASIFGSADVEEHFRLLDGGVLTGRPVNPWQKGLDVECISLTLLKESTEREVLSFAQVGSSKQSFSRAFASVLKPPFKERHTTALRGEARPCVFCGYCENVCPAKLIPHVIYRYIVNDRAEEAWRFGLGRCVECGLCSYVCLSKIEHLEVFIEEKAKFAEENDHE